MTDNTTPQPGQARFNPERDRLIREGELRTRKSPRLPATNVALNPDVRSYRKLPVVIAATRVTTTNTMAVSLWCGGRPMSEAKASDHTDVAYWVDIPTLEGVMRASVGDYVIKGVNGEFYPCKPEIFEKTYEEYV